MVVVLPALGSVGVVTSFTSMLIVTMFFSCFVMVLRITLKLVEVASVNQ